MNNTLKGIGFLVLLAAVMLGWSALVPKTEPLPTVYYYDYSLPEDSLTVGHTLVVQSVDTVYDGKSRATINVVMAAR